MNINQAANTANAENRLRLSIIIPSAPGRQENVVIENLRRIKPAGIDFQIIVVKGTWFPTQRNLAIKKAGGDFIFLFDDDIIIPQGSIEAALKIFTENPEIQVLGGPNITPEQNSFMQHCFGAAHASFFTAAGTAIRYHRAVSPKIVTENHLITCNLAFRAKILKENLFDEEICPNEENDLLGRIRRSGGKLAYNKDFFVYHHRRKTLGKFILQIFKWGEGRSLHTIKRPAHFSPVFLAPLVFFIYLVSLSWVREAIYFAPLGLYLLLDIIFSIHAAFSSRKFFALFVMPWLFPVTHIAYAFGTLYGVRHVFQKSKLHPEELDHLLIEINIS